MPSATPLLDFAAHWVLFALVATGAFVYVRRARQTATGRRVAAGNALVFLALATGLFAAGETYMRFVFDQTTWHTGTLTTRAWLDRHGTLNADGFRDIDFDRDKPAGVTRVAVVGDSFAYGFGIADRADRTSDRVRAALEERSPGAFQVWNFGVVGANTQSQTMLLRNLLTTVRLDRVILIYSPNDVEDLLPRDRIDQPPYSVAQAGSLRSRSYLLDHIVVRASLYDTAHSERYFDDLGAFHRDPARFGGQAQRLDALARMCRGVGVRLDVLVYPLISHWGPDYPFGGWHDRIGSAWKAAGIDVIDLRPVFAGTTAEDLRVNPLDPHPNERANALVAEEVLRRLF